MNIASIDSKGDVPCASCNSNWSVPLLADLHSKQGLRSAGFAFIWFNDGAICVNHCPHCESSTKIREVQPWPISPLFP